MKIEGDIWIETSSGLRIGKGRASLLEQIGETGSIAEASRRLGIPYRRAWGMIKEMNDSATEPLVIKSVGGKDGGRTTLTPEGVKVFLNFKKVNQKFAKFKNRVI